MDDEKAPYEANRMTVAQLIEKLQAMPQHATVYIAVADPADTAYSDDEITVENAGDKTEVRIGAWVASDNPKANAPWSEWDED